MVTRNDPPAPPPVLPSLLEGLGGQEKQFAHFQSDAPSCDNCGALTVRCGPAIAASIAATAWAVPENQLPP
jgi:hypothetical protein